MKIEMKGHAALRADVRTVDDLRQLVKALDESKVRGDVEAVWGEEYVYINVVDTAKATWIECGDHLPGHEQWDVLLETHHHDDHEQPAMFDWPSKDRAKRFGAYHRTGADYCYDNGHSYADDVCYVCGVGRSLVV